MTVSVSHFYFMLLSYVSMILVGNAQTPSLQNLKIVEGYVLTENREPIEYVNIMLTSDKQRQTLTDQRGHFKLTLTKGKHNILFTHTGYTDFEVTVEVHTSQTHSAKGGHHLQHNIVHDLWYRKHKTPASTYRGGDFSSNYEP
jgi:hypothetical protein